MRPALRGLATACWTVCTVGALCAATGLAAGLTACGGPRRPPPPRPDRDPLALLGGSDGTAAPTVADLLAAYPLGGEPFRADLLASTDEHSIFLVQSRRGVPAHFHRTHRERTHVLSGSGTCFVDTRSYPAVEGSAFRIEAGLVHRVEATGGAPLVALVIYEPPMATFDEDRVRVGN